MRWCGWIVLVCTAAGCASGDSDAALSGSAAVETTAASPAEVSSTELRQVSSTSLAAVRACIDAVQSSRASKAEAIELCDAARTTVSSDLGSGSKLASHLGLLAGVYALSDLDPARDLDLELGLWVKEAKALTP